MRACKSVRARKEKAYLHLFVQLQHFSTFLADQHLLEPTLLARRRRPYEVRAVDETFRRNVISGICGTEFWISGNERDAMRAKGDVPSPLTEGKECDRSTQGEIKVAPAG